MKNTTLKITKQADGVDLDFGNVLARFTDTADVLNSVEKWLNPPKPKFRDGIYKCENANLYQVRDGYAVAVVIWSGQWSAHIICGSPIDDKDVFICDTLAGLPEVTVGPEYYGVMEDGKLRLYGDGSCAVVEKGRVDYLWPDGRRWTGPGEVSRQPV